MVFSPQRLTPELKDALVLFMENQNFPKLYQSYKWKRDTYENGFPDIAVLETKMSHKSMIELKDLIRIAEWGELRNTKRIGLPTGNLKLDLYQKDGRPSPELERDPLTPLLYLQRNVEGFGPTYLTKTLRFALAQEYGALDTRIVRVFGKGDYDSKQQDWLNLQTRNNGYGWYISKYQSCWPSEYAKWIDILRFFAEQLNGPENPRPCPHPARFKDLGLRVRGLWSCADIEMAIFSYASQFVK